MSDSEFNFSVSGDGLVSIKVNNTDGTSSNKVVRYEDFARIFLMDNQDIDLPLFPKGIRKYIVRGDRTLVAIEYPETKFSTVNWASGDEYKDIPVPPSLWLTLLQNNADGTYKIIKNNCFALGFTGFRDYDSVLYKWPFPNHSLTYGTGICWGNDSNFKNMKNDCQLTDLPSLFNIYFSSQFNNDLGYYIQRGDDEAAHHHIFQIISGSDTYLERWLISEEGNFASSVNNLIGAR